MINIEYKTNPKEFAKASITYLEKNAFVALILFFMNLSCWLALLGYVLKYNGGIEITILDNFAGSFAACWILFRRKINTIILQRSLKKRKISDLTAKVNVDKNRISWYTVNNQRHHLPWDKIAKIYNSKQGYIIPRVLNGPLNSTFIWLPKSGFKSADEETNFIDIMKNSKAKIKKIK